MVNVNQISARLFDGNSAEKMKSVLNKLENSGWKCRWELAFVLKKKI